MKKYLTRTWVSPKLAPGRSKIHGAGVFAAVAIPKGEKLMEFGGLAISRDDIASEHYRARSIWMVGDDRFLGLPETDLLPSLDENLNHACDANSWLADEVTLAARTNITAGAEITLDQGTWNFEEGVYLVDRPACSCRSALCRKRLTEKDWKLPDLQRRYKGHFHPLIQRMIDARQG